jgi:hypothetical protein
MAGITMKQSTDLAAEVFAILRREFFDAALRPKAYALRDKRNTQDDPFDEALHGILKRELPAGVECEKATGPLITPDMVVLRTAECVGVDRGELERSPVLVHQADKVTCSAGDLVRIGTIRRQCRAGGTRMFYCYGCPGDYGSDSKAFDLVDPFPTPKRKKKTQPRGKFRLSISTEG